MRQGEKLTWPGGCAANGLGREGRRGELMGLTVRQ